MASSAPPVVLFGYDSSTFTQKIRLVLKIKQIPYTFVAVPSMMPRPILRNNFNLTYRKIPVLAIGREIYCDTSLITEALEHYFSEGFPSIYPPAADGRDYRPMMRGFASYWIDRPFFRVTTGLIPSSVWRSSFGVDRAGLIGHKLNPDKLEAKLPRNLSNLDLQLSILEPLFQSSGPWMFSTATPSLADISLYYQLSWGNDIAAGRDLADLSGGELSNTNTEGTASVFNPTRYPALHRWYTAMQEYRSKLPLTEKKASAEEAVQQMRRYTPPRGASLLIPTPNKPHYELDNKNGLVPGTRVSVAPDDTGRDDPTIGTLVDLSTEEVVIKPLALGSPAAVDIRVHFPRFGFVVVPVRTTKL